MKSLYVFTIVDPSLYFYDYDYTKYQNVLILKKKSNKKFILIIEMFTNLLFWHNGFLKQKQWTDFSHVSSDHVAIKSFEKNFRVFVLLESFSTMPIYRVFRVFHFFFLNNLLRIKNIFNKTSHACLIKNTNYRFCWRKIFFQFQRKAFAHFLCNVQ